MRTMSLQSSVVYGPVTSRRFGRSLGLNLLPATRRICTFDCVYCQYRDDRADKDWHFPTVDEIERHLEARLKECALRGEKLDWLTFSGNGEPTLHPQFPAVVQSVLALRDRLMPGVSVGILSNSSTSFLPRIRQALEPLDGRFMKLDAGNLHTFELLNRPHSPFMWGDVVLGLSLLRPLVIQSMFVAGIGGNADERSVEDWIEAVGCIGPSEVQVYTIDREPQEEGVLPVPEDQLRRIADELRLRTSIPAEVY